MKHSKYILPLLLAALLAGCGKPANPTPPSVANSTTPTVPPVAAPSNPAAPPASFTPTAPPATTAAGDPPASSSLAQVGADVKQTAQDVKDYTYAEKDAFVKKVQADLDDLNAELDRLTAKIASAGEATKLAAQSKIDFLNGQITLLKADLDQAKNSTEDSWDKVKATAKKDYDDTKRAFKDAVDWLDKQLNA